MSSRTLERCCFLALEGSDGVYLLLPNMLETLLLWCTLMLCVSSVSRSYKQDDLTMSWMPPLLCVGLKWTCKHLEMLNVIWASLLFFSFLAQMPHFRSGKLTGLNTLHPSQHPRKCRLKLVRNQLPSEWNPLKIWTTGSSTRQSLKQHLLQERILHEQQQKTKQKQNQYNLELLHIKIYTTEKRVRGTANKRVYFSILIITRRDFSARLCVQEKCSQKKSQTQNKETLSVTVWNPQGWGHASPSHPTYSHYKATVHL